MFCSQEAALTDSAGRLHEPGDDTDKHFIAPVKMGSYNPAAHSFQAASIFKEKNEMCDATFASELQYNIWLASIGTEPKEIGETERWIHLGSSQTESQQSKLSSDTLARNW